VETAALSLSKEPVEYPDEPFDNRELQADYARPRRASRISQEMSHTRTTATNHIDYDNEYFSNSATVATMVTLMEIPQGRRA
jgi:hypothetical protein